jgi:UDP-N-acetylmuramate--alanine ligase
MPTLLSIKPSIKSAHHIHFCGIKGVGMTAAALCVQDLGIPLSGTDIEEDFVTEDILRVRNIPMTEGFFDPSYIPADTDLLIYTAAHQGKNNPQVLSALKRGIRTISHAESVGELMVGKIGISVCGVGGKTSTSAMLANIFDYAGKSPSYLIGVGKVLNLQAPGHMDVGKHFIAEADEYVVSPGVDNTPRFAFQTPSVIVCTNISYDHPDVYASIEDTKKTFKAFFDKLPSDGLLVANANSGPLGQVDLSGKKVIWYGKTPDRADWWVKGTYQGQDKQLVTLASQNMEFNLTLSVPGDYNAENALAAYITARHLGIDHQPIIEALQLFRGSMRRFEKIGESGGIVYYDDYAHHPSQIYATLKAARQWLPLNRLVVVFQPHTYSRTKALMQNFSKSFSFADVVIVTDIYASSREQPDPSVSGYTLAEETKKYHQNVHYIPFASLVPELMKLSQPADAIFTMGAGNIYQIHHQLMAK